MKRLLLGLALAVGAYACWVTSPPSRYEAQYQAAYQRQRARLEAQSHADGDNAYSDPVLGPVLRGTPNSAGDLQAGLNRPYLVVPLHQPFQVEALLASRASALDLLHFAGLPGSWLDSLAFLRHNLKLRRRTLENLQLERLSQVQLERLLSELARTQLHSEDYVQAFEGSLLDSPGRPPAGGVFELPGVPARELRLFKNDYVAQLERVRAGENFAPLAGDAQPDWDWVCGRHGVKRSPYLLPIENFHDEFENVRRLQAFQHLLAGIVRERLQTGQWPVSLEEMSDYLPLPELDRKAVHYHALGDVLEVSWGDWNFKPPVPRPR